MIGNKTVKIIEFLLLCVVFPGIIIFGGYGKSMMLFLWAATIYCFVIFRTNYIQDLRGIWNWRAVHWQNLKPIIVRWIIACGAMFAFMWFYDPDRLFNIWYRNPTFIPILFFVYPILSALPQEFIFCSFFFKRYEILFGAGKWMVLTSALVFAYAHVLYINPVAPVISFIGGLIFAQTYLKTKSLALVTIEHGLYGNALFFIGLGYYFYSGAIGAH